MPELPEVETVARGVAKRVNGDVIESVWTSRKPQTFKSSPREIDAMLSGASVKDVRRVGKHIVMDLEKGSAGCGQFIVHLGMTGNLIVVNADTEQEKHTHLIAQLRSGRELRFVDPRRFGRLAVRKQGDCFAAAGAEPLTIGFDDFAALFRGRKTPIKSALLNQKLLSGVGNIYADESLFRARVRPRRLAGKVTQAEMKLLYAGLRKVLQEAILAGGSSISDYVDAGGDQGMFQVNFRVYGREGEPCVRCKTPIKRIVIAGRSAHYCPKCQK